MARIDPYVNGVSAERTALYKMRLEVAPPSGELKTNEKGSETEVFKRSLKVCRNKKLEPQHVSH